MADLKLVTPFSVSTRNNEEVLGLLKNWTRPELAPPQVDQVPVFDNVDYATIISGNDRRMPLLSAHTTSSNDKQEDSDSGTAAKDENDDVEETPPSYVPLAAFSPKNRLEQLTTVFFPDFPALKKRYISKVFELLLQACALSGSGWFRFSVISESFNDTRGVFVRFSGTSSTQWALAAATVVFPSLSGVFDHSLSPANADTLDSESLDRARVSIAEIFKNKKYFSQGSSRSGTADLDEVMDYYRTYKVEHSELVEVPKDMKEVIVRDIIKFRSKVLSLEREARRKELEKERRKARARLTSIFEEIKASAAKDTSTQMKEDASQAPSVVAEAPVTDLEPSSALDSMSDVEYTEYLAKREKEELDNEYEAKRKAVVSLEQKEKAPLLEQLQAAKDYESSLVENKLFHMDEVKVFSELDASSFLSGHPSTFTASIDPLAKLYFTRHREYLRLRNQERTKEEAADDLDRLEEEESGQHTEESSMSLFTKHASSSKDAKAVKPSQVPDFVVSQLTPEKLGLVKDKISALVEEYLGIKEDLLIDLVYDFLMEHNLSRNDELMAELSETLEEDSKTVVEQLSDYLMSL